MSTGDILINFAMHTEPGFYKASDFGVRIGNVLEVVDTDKIHPSGSKFLAFKDITMVPYEEKLIDVALLSTQEARAVVILFNDNM